MKRADVTDADMIAIARAYRDGLGPDLVTALTERGVPVKVALAKIEHMVSRGLLSYGVHPSRAHVVEDAIALKDVDPGVL